MLGSISPVGESARGQRWWLTATAYTLASTAAGASAGALLGAVGQAVLAVAPGVSPWRLPLLGTAMVAAVLADAGVVRRVPSWQRQVDERWLTTYRGWVYGAGFGAQLGVGVVTIVTSATVWVTLAAAALAAWWWAGALIGATFGLARSMPLLAMVRVRTAARLHAVTGRVAAAAPLARRVTVATHTALAAAVWLATLS